MDATPVGPPPRCLSIAGIPVLVTATASTAQTVDELFAVAEEHPGPPVVTMSVTDDPVEAPDAEADETYDTIHLWRTGDHVVVDSGCGVFADADARAITVRGAVSGTQYAIGLRRALHHALSHTLSLNGRTIVHGAAVARESRAVLLLGSTGSGKSTCSYLAGKAGWDVIADDLLALWIDDGAIWATGIPRALAVPADVLTAEEMSDDRDALDRDPRNRRRLTQPLHMARCTIVASAIVAHGAGDGDLVPAGGAELLHYVVASAPASGHAAVARDAFLVAGILTRRPMWKLLTADTPEGRTAHVPGQLERLLASGA